ncbi:MAG TPA: hypothetical protein VI136_10235 [Verrucomicrobiae bacterium]
MKARSGVKASHYCGGLAERRVARNGSNSAKCGGDAEPGLTRCATLTAHVLPAAPIGLAALPGWTSLVLNGAGGGPRQTQMTTNTTLTLWRNSSAATLAANASISPTNADPFLRLLNH